MATAVLNGHGFAEGTSVSAWPAENFVNGGPPSGSSVATATVTTGALTFTGLTVGRRYVAYASGRGVAFRADEALGVDSASPEAPERTRLQYTEAAVGAVETTAALKAAKANLVLNAAEAFGIYSGIVADSGTTDNGPGVQARLDYIKAAGTTPSKGLYFPQPATAGAYYGFATGLSVDGAYGLAMFGDGAHRGPVRLDYTGTGTFISAKPTNGCAWIGLYLSSFSDAACLLDMSNAAGPGGPDSTLNTVERCHIRATNGAACPTIGIKMGQCTASTISKVFFDGGHTHILGNTSNTGYSNSNKVKDCYHQLANTAAIRNPGQSWHIGGGTFEPLRDGSSIAIVVDSGYEVQHITINDGCSFQDATTTGSWIKLRGAGAEISGCFANTGGKFIEFAGNKAGSGAFDGANVSGNTIWAMTVAGVDGGTLGVTNFEEDGNRWNANAADLIGNVNANLGGVLVNSDGHTTASSGATWPSANRSIFVRYVPRKTHTATGIAYHCTTLDAGNPNVDVAVLDSSRNRLASSGSTAGKLNATGVQYVAFTAPIVLRKGVVYYVGMGSASATPAVAFMGTFSSGTTAELVSNATPNLYQGLRDTSVPIANPVGALSSVASAPLMALRTA